jgi:hypothetical protein
MVMPRFFNCPSPRGTNRAKLFLDERGRLFDKSGGFWGRSSIAMDAALPESLAPAKEDDGGKGRLEKLRQQRNLLEREIEDLEVRHEGKSFDRGRDAEPTDRLAEFRKRLRQAGMDDETIKRACEMAAAMLTRSGEAEGEGADVLPTSGPAGLGGHIGGRVREFGESKVFQDGEPWARVGRDVFEPDRARFDSFTPTPVVRGQRRQPRANDSAFDVGEKSLLRKFGADFARVGRA